MKVELKGLHRVTAKGRVYYYAWRGGPALRAAFGTPEFLSEFLAARASAPADGDDFAASVRAYRNSPEYAALAPSTKRLWGMWLDRIEEHFGSTLKKAFDRPAIRREIKGWRDEWRYSPRSADYALQVLSRVISFAVDEGDIAQNLCIGISRLYTSDRSEIIWSEDDITVFCASAPKELAWAVRLAALTGLRRGDILRLTWAQIGGASITVKTGKSRERRSAEIPLTKALRALLDEIPKRSPVVLTNSYGRPWRGFGGAFQRAFKKAWPEGRDLHFHDLRGTACTNLHLAGLTSSEIALILAWSVKQVDRILARYLNRAAVVRNMVERIEKRTSAVKRSVKRAAHDVSKQA